MSTKLRIGVTLATLVILSVFAQPGHAQSPADQADSEFEQGHYQKACDLYRLALATKRNDVSILLRAAKAYDAAGNLDEAIVRAREATSVAQDNANAHFALGHYLDANRDTRAAFMQFAEVLDLKNVDPAMRKAAYAPILRLGKQLKEWDKALKYAKQCSREYKQDADSHYNYAWMLAQVPDRSANEFIKLRAESVNEYKKSIELGEKRPQVHLNLAMVLVDCDNFADAKLELAKYLRMTPEARSDDAVLKLEKQINEKKEAPAK